MQAVRRLILAFETYRNEVARFYGLSVLETQTVSHLMAAGELGPTEIGQRLGVTPGSVTALLDRLTIEGIVTRRPHPSDRRRTVVTLTDRGRGLIEDSARWFEHAVDGIDDEQLPVFLGMVDRMVENMDRQTAVIAQEPRPAQGLRA